MTIAAGTKLSEALRAGTKGGAVSPLDLFKLARKRWVNGDRVDVGRLASELGIGRATAFRWVGSRDALLGEVIWSYYEPTLRKALESEASRGAERIAQVTAKAMRAVLRFGPMRRWLEQDPDYALRIVTDEAGVVQARTATFVQQMLQQEIDEGYLDPLLDVETLSLLVLRISASFLYSDITCGREPSVESAYTAIRILAAATPANGTG